MFSHRHGASFGRPDTALLPRGAGGITEGQHTTLVAVSLAAGNYPSDGTDAATVAALASLGLVTVTLGKAMITAAGILLL